MRRILCFLMIFSIISACTITCAENEENNAPTGLWGWISGAADSVSGWATDTADSVSGWASYTAGNVSEWVNGAAEDVSDWASNAYTNVKDWTTAAAANAADWSAQAAADAWGWMSTAAGNVSDWTVVAANETWNWTMVAAKDAGEWAGTAAINSWNLLKSSAANAWKTTTQKITGTWKDIFGLPDGREPKGLCVDMALLKCAKQLSSVEENGAVTECYSLDDTYDISITTMKRPENIVPPYIGDVCAEDFIASLFDNTAFSVSTLCGAGHRAMAQSLDLVALRGETPIIGKALTVWTDDYIMLAVITTESGTDDPEQKQELADMLNLWTETTSVYEVYEDEGETEESDTSDKGSTSTLAEAGTSTAARVITSQRMYEEVKFNAQNGFGFVAENANNLGDKILGIFTGTRAEVIGGDNAKNGADRRLTQGTKTTLIQTKYHSTAYSSIDACFENGKFRYYASENKPMLIEVPPEQYDDAIIEFARRISEGQVDGVTDPAEAEQYIKKGKISYKQAKNIAEHKFLSSVTYDIVNSAIECTSSLGISAATEFAVGIWQGEDAETALNQAISTGLDVYGSSFVVSVISSQLSRTALNSWLTGSSEAVVKVMGTKAAHNFAKAFGKNIWGAAATRNAAKILRMNAITSTVSLVVESVPSIIDMAKGRISGTQLIKNVAETGGGIAGGSAGWFGGATLGSMILPGVGTVIGGIVGSVAGGYAVQTLTEKVVGIFIEDDADQMLDIISDQLQVLSEEYLLGSDEINSMITGLSQTLTSTELQDMFSSSYRTLYAREIIVRPMAEEAVASRSQVELPDDQTVNDEMIKLLESADVA